MSIHRIILSELLFPGENSKHYCGKRVLTCHCCNGVCEEPGCNCTACAQLDVSQEEVMSQHKHSEQVISSWTWKQSVGRWM